MKKYWTKNKVIFIVMVVLIAAIIPFIINWAYKKGGYVTVWDGSDLLAFYGNILTAAAAIIGVYYTLDYSKFKQMEYESLKVKPYLDVESHFVLHNYLEVFCPDPKNEFIYMYTDLTNEHFENAQNGLTPTVFDIYKRKGDVQKNNFVHNSFVVLMTIKNIGADSAIRINFWSNNHKCSKIFSLKKNKTQDLRLIFFLGNEQEQKNSLNDKHSEITINLKLLYENIYGNQTYMQSGNIKVIKQESYGILKVSTISGFFSNQTEINN